MSDAVARYSMTGLPLTLTMVCVRGTVPRLMPPDPMASCQNVTVPVGADADPTVKLLLVEYVTCAVSVSDTPAGNEVNCGVRVVVVVSLVTVADLVSELGALVESPV